MKSHPKDDKNVKDVMIRLGGTSVRKISNSVYVVNVVPIGRVYFCILGLEWALC
jgi:hypothetical protein